MLWFPAACAWALVAGAARWPRLADRLALGLPSERPTPGAIWIHALSVGEVLSALPLVENLARTYPQTDLVFTVTTRQGMKIASRSLAGKINWLLPMPFDFPWSINRIAGHIRPSLFILVETDIWPGLLGCLKRKNVPRILVNGRISPRTFKAYRRFSPFAQKLLNGFDLCLMQTSLDRDRLVSVGISPQRVKTVGNIKFDRIHEPMLEEERRRWQSELGLEIKDRVWLAGSTHPGEDTIVLTVFKRLLEKNARLRLIIAPRKIETAGSILKQARLLGLETRLRTDAPQLSTEWKVLVIDTLGELGRIYGLSDINFVGGSLVEKGGHNLLEPAAFARPVIFGPHTYNFDKMAGHLEKTGGGIRVSDENTLCASVEMLLDDDRKRRVTGKKAQAFVAQNQGNVKRVMSHIETILSRTDQKRF